MSATTVLDKDGLVSSHWGGFANIRYLFIFGDSYSDVGYNPSEPDPTDEEPLGVPYPGIALWTESPDAPNWVGYLVTENSQPKLLAYDYAVGGATVDGVTSQVHDHFLPYAGNEDSHPSWGADNSLFVTWVGINDLGEDVETPSEALTKLFALQDELYKAGARNFLFLNVPPLPRPKHAAPTSSILAEIAKGRTGWNTCLSSMMNNFSKEKPNTSTLLFDAHSAFVRVLNDPEGYGFPKGSGHAADGEMYWDHIHPTSAFHAIVARELGEFLARE